MAAYAYSAINSLGVESLGDTAERLRTLIAHFQLTDARRQAVDIPVIARSAAWSEV